MLFLNRFFSRHEVASAHTYHTHALEKLERLSTKLKIHSERRKETPSKSEKKKHIRKSEKNFKQVEKI